MRSRLCCPCAGVLRQPERISHGQCCHSSGMRIGHGSGLWYRWPTTETPGDRQVKPISNAALPAPLAAFKSPDGEQDRRGDEGSCGSRSEGERCRWDLVHHQGLGPGLWVAGQRGAARSTLRSRDPPALLRASPAPRDALPWGVKQGRYIALAAFRLSDAEATERTEKSGFFGVASRRSGRP